MSCKPLTKKEWEASIAEMWSSAVESTYQDMIDAAVKSEREACAKVCDDLADKDKLSNYYRVAANAIRQRSTT